MGGNFTNNGTFTHNSGTVTFNGTGAQSISGSTTTFNNLTVNKSSGTLTLAANTSVAGDLSVSAGTFDLSSFTVDRTSSGGALTVSNGATLKIGGNNTLPTNYSTITLGTTSTVEYYGAGQTIQAATYGNLVLSGNSDKTPSDATLTISGNLTLDTGHLIAPSSTLNIAGNWTNNGGTFTAGGGTVTFNGSSSGGGQVITGTTTTTFNNLIINSGALVGLGTKPLISTGGTVTNSGVITETLTVSDGATQTFVFIGTDSTSGDRYKGVTLTDSAGGGGNPGTTTVSVFGGQTCGSGAGTVARCYQISPTTTTGQNVTLTLYFDHSQLNGNTCSTLKIWRDANGGGLNWTQEGGGYINTCPGSGTESVQVTGVANFSIFAASSSQPNAPTAVRLRSFGARPGERAARIPPSLLVSGALLLIAGGVWRWGRRRA